MSVDRKRIQLLGCVSLAALGVALMPDAASAQGAVCGTFVNPALVLPPPQGNTGNNATNTACGPGASTVGATSATAIGQSAEVTAGTKGGIAIGGDTNNGGVSATASASGAIAIGSDNSTPAQGALASGVNSVALGESSRSTANSSVAVGSVANATGNFSVAVGKGASATAQFATAVGGGNTDPASATGNGSNAFGNSSVASGAESTAIGGSTASGVNSTAVGVFSNAAGDSSFAGGDGAQALGSQCHRHWHGRAGRCVGRQRDRHRHGCKVATDSIAIGAALQRIGRQHRGR